MPEEKPIREPQEAYVTEIPPYYDRFLEERDRRIAAELHELRSLVEINTQRIEELRADLLRGLAEAREERLRGFEEAREERQRDLEEAREERQRGFEEAREERQRGFEEAREERQRGFKEARADRQSLHERLDRLERKADTNFRWTIGLLMPIVIGVLVIIARSFFGLP